MKTFRMEIERLLDKELPKEIEKLYENLSNSSFIFLLVWFFIIIPIHYELSLKKVFLFQRVFIIYNLYNAN